jgi:DNA processing protein
LDKLYAAALHLLLGLELNSLYNEILLVCGSFEAFWKSRRVPPDIRLSAESRERLDLGKKQLEPERLADRYERAGICWVTRAESEFSKSLLTIYNVPCILYYHGRLSLLDQLSLAVVGSRKPTPYGIAQCKSITGELSRKGVCVVSGMALGIDKAAHEGALYEKGSTIAVFGAGIDWVYPKQNFKLYQAIREHGLVISEFPPGTVARPWHFPVRNRIISGLSQGVMVVEAQARSGSLITVEHALEQNREVFALPGPVSSALSIGPLRLIQQGAKAVINAHDIFEEIGIPFEEGARDQDREKSSLDEHERRLMLKIGYEPVHIDHLLQTCNGDGALFARLMELEWKGRIQSIPGNFYVRVN